jgi:hypothetical protein
MKYFGKNQSRVEHQNPPEGSEDVRNREWTQMDANFLGLKRERTLAAA